MIFYDRWLIPPYPRVLNFAKFYETKEDFNQKYGLSLEGVDPVVLTNKLISGLVYKVTRVKDKVKLKHV